MPNRRSRSTLSRRKKARKRRTIKNAVVNIDDVFIARGEANVNWLSIAKDKLTDRELKILRKRQRILDQNIITALYQFIQDNKNTFDFNVCIDIYNQEIRRKLISPQSAIISVCSQAIADILHKWKGCKTEKHIGLFRDYFQHCRHWFDTKKIRMMAIHFWIPSMLLIQEFATKVAVRCFAANRELQTALADYLNVLVLESVFTGEMKNANARRMWLVPAMSYRLFLKRYNHHLHIVFRKHLTKHKDIRREYLKCLRTKRECFKQVFHTALNQPMMPSIPVPPQVDCNPFSFDDTPDARMAFQSNLHYQTPSFRCKPVTTSPPWSAKDPFAVKMNEDTKWSWTNQTTTLPPLAQPMYNGNCTDWNGPGCVNGFQGKPYNVPMRNTNVFSFDNPVLPQSDHQLPRNPISPQLPPLPTLPTLPSLWCSQGTFDTSTNTNNAFSCTPMNTNNEVRCTTVPCDSYHDNGYVGCGMPFELEPLVDEPPNLFTGAPEWNVSML